VNVLLGSMFRNSESYLPHYIAQVEALGALLRRDGHTLRVVAVEGDSTDGTAGALYQWAIEGPVSITYINRSDGCRHWPSVNHPDRWRHLAWCANGVLEEVDPNVDDVVIYVEADLIWHPTLPLKLMKMLERPGVDCVTPMLFHVSGFYYDTWGSRLGGACFRAGPPYHSVFLQPSLDEVDLIPVDSACGMTVMDAGVAYKARFQPEDCYVGLARNIREQGHTYWLAFRERVEHP
jgi:hypothetical protein